MTYDRRDWQERQMQALKREIADRLRSVCEQVPDDEFGQLVERIARIQLKYEKQSGDERVWSAAESEPPVA